jgi:hypothetical protein
MAWHRSFEEGWAWHPTPTVNLGSSYPTRVDTSDADPDYQPRPVGFTADLGTAKPATESDEGWELVEAEILCHDRPEPCLDGCTGPPKCRRARCTECGDADGHHFRYCTQGET